MIDWVALDKQLAKEVGAPASAWIHVPKPSTLEMRIADNLAPVASAIDEGQQWFVSTSTGVTFTSDPISARRMLWAAATAAPAPPAVPTARTRRRTS